MVRVKRERVERGTGADRDDEGEESEEQEVARAGVMRTVKRERAQSAGAEERNGGPVSGLWNSD